MKHLEVRQKYSAARRIFNSLLGVLSGDETLHLMFDILLEHLRQKAPHVLFSLGRHTDFSKLKPSLASNIFDTMISPILTYRDSEVWSAFVKSDFKSLDNSGIEKTHLHFCK